jgi:1-hydroxycarotenoid 3,4-desaturase
VFFSNRYEAEFDDIFSRDKLPAAPTVYVCAQDRDDSEHAPPGAERLLCLVNAPANGDRATQSLQDIDRCTETTFAHLARCGLQIQRQPDCTLTTAPQDFATLYPATGGALYGQAVHGAMASFRRPGVRTTLPGLYLAGGSTHPGAGVPMAALSGRMAAERVLADSVSTALSRPTATSGGMSMR